MKKMITINANMRVIKSQTNQICDSLPISVYYLMHL